MIVVMGSSLMESAVSGGRVRLAYLFANWNIGRRSINTSEAFRLLYPLRPLAPAFLPSQSYNLPFLRAEPWISNVGPIP